MTEPTVVAFARAALANPPTGGYDKDQQEAWVYQCGYLKGILEDLLSAWDEVQPAVALGNEVAACLVHQLDVEDGASRIVDLTRRLEAHKRAQAIIDEADDS